MGHLESGIFFGIMGALILATSVLFLVAPEWLVDIYRRTGARWAAMSRSTIGSPKFRVRFVGVCELVLGLAAVWGAIFHLSQV